jgi:predicted AAA+ superfamily ATPase
MSKFYFYDTGLAAHLLGIDSSEQLDLHVSKGALFENLIIVDLIKRRFNEAKRNNLFFWRDSAGNELDVLIEQASGLIPIEIKSGQTITSQYFKGLNYWQKITGSEGGYVVYAGKTIEKRSKQQMVLPFTALENIKDQFFKP